MTVVAGNVALVSDYNTLRSEVNKWFADNYPSVTFGQSNRNYGWGGAEIPSISNIAMAAANMNEFVDRCNIAHNMLTHITMPLSSITSGNIITATDLNDIDAKSYGVTYYRNDVTSAEMSLVTGGSSVRSTSWSTAITYEFSYSILNFKTFRYFWNTGGGINLSGSITGYSTGSGWDGAGFNEIFTTMGTITLNYTETVQSGSGGVPTNIGFYDLTTSYQTVFSQTGSGAYTDAQILIQAKYDFGGALVKFLVTLTPGSGRSVNGTTTLTTQYRKLDNQSSGLVSLSITAPSYSLDSSL